MLGKNQEYRHKNYCQRLVVTLRPAQNEIIAAEKLGKRQRRSAFGKLCGLKAHRPENEPRARAFDVGSYEYRHCQQQQHGEKNRIGIGLVDTRVDKKQYKARHKRQSYPTDLFSGEFCERQNRGAVEVVARGIDAQRARNDENKIYTDRPPVDGWEIKRYSDGCKDEWDDFVRDSRNGTFLFMRGYMDYHADRFADFSLMAYRDGRLHALLPAHCTATEFCSHRGLTYGGVVTDEKMTVALMLELFWEIFRYLRTYTSVGKWIYSPVPYIYARYPSEEDLYALYRFGARLSGRKVSTVVPSATAWGFSTLRRRKVKHAVREGLSISRDEDFSAFWKVLEGNLMERHQSRPVHTLKEIMLLHHRFPQQILLYRVCRAEGRTVAGCVLYVTERVVHVQYIGSTPEGRACGAVDLLFHHLIHEEYKDVPYFDMGTSVEEGGRVLNEGLIFQKEGFGGRAVVYDTYEMEV